MARCNLLLKMAHFPCVSQVKFDDLFLVQCFKLCFLETKDRLAGMMGIEIDQEEKITKQELTHKIETYFV